MISERLLKQWRRDALSYMNDVKDMHPEAKPILEVCERILRLTQELLDQHLIRK